VKTELEEKDLNSKKSPLAFNMKAKKRIWVTLCCV